MQCSLKGTVPRGGEECNKDGPLRNELPTARDTVPFKRPSVGFIH